MRSLTESIRWLLAAMLNCKRWLRSRLNRMLESGIMAEETAERVAQRIRGLPSFPFSLETEAGDPLGTARTLYIRGSIPPQGGHRGELLCEVSVDYLGKDPSPTVLIPLQQLRFDESGTKAVTSKDLIEKFLDISSSSVPESASVTFDPAKDVGIEARPVDELTKEARYMDKEGEEQRVHNVIQRFRQEADQIVADATSDEYALVRRFEWISPGTRRLVERRVPRRP